jgi:hypothetical protein
MTTPVLERSWTHEGRPELNLRGLEAGPGPWDDEPDKVQWIDGATGLDCLAVRGPMGAWCGYVGVPPGHRWHGAGYWDLDVRVHGELTFASSCDESAAEGHGVCHVPFPGRPADVWWLGFDCGHAGDRIPTMPDHSVLGWPDVYRDLGYVRGECADLARQVAAAAA